MNIWIQTCKYKGRNVCIRHSDSHTHMKTNSRTLRSIQANRDMYSIYCMYIHISRYTFILQNVHTDPETVKSKGVMGHRQREKVRIINVKVKLKFIFAKQSVYIACVLPAIFLGGDITCYVCFQHTIRVL